MQAASSNKDNTRERKETQLPERQRSEWMRKNTLSHPSGHDSDLIRQPRCRGL